MPERVQCDRTIVDNDDDDNDVDREKEGQDGEVQRVSYKSFKDRPMSTYNGMYIPCVHSDPADEQRNVRSR